MRGYLLDMDGVIYRGSHPIPGAVEFVNHLRRTETPFVFLTNNSQRTARDVATKLRRIGFLVEESHIFTCAMATARFLAAQKPGGTAYVIGEGGLLNALHAHGYSIVDSDADYVVVGEGRTITFEMIETAVNIVMNGAKLIATNPDPNCPTQHGLRPGCGAITAMIERATDVEAFSVGKPSPIMMRAARKVLGLTADETIMVGDTMETDILGGVQMGYETVLVLTGARTRRRSGGSHISRTGWWTRSRICCRCGSGRRRCGPCRDRQPQPRIGRIGRIQRIRLVGRASVLASRGRGRGQWTGLTGFTG